MFKRIVWSTDGSEWADLALPYVRSLAREHEAEIVVVHAEELLTGSRAGRFPVEIDEEGLKAKVKQQVAELSEDGANVTLRVIVGGAPGAAHMIAEAAEEADADLIVVGTRGHTPVAGLLLGSVTQRLLHIAPCAVLVVPAPRQ